MYVFTHEWRTINSNIHSDDVCFSKLTGTDASSPRAVTCFDLFVVKSTLDVEPPTNTPPTNRKHVYELSNLFIKKKQNNNNI